MSVGARVTSDAAPAAKRSRLARNVAAIALLAGLFAGTFVWQTDDTWPLAQMRMFPGGDESNVVITIVEAHLVDGRTREMNPFDFHLKRADLEGQMGRVVRNPAMLGALVRRYNRTVPRQREIVWIRCVRRETVHEHGRTRHLEREVVRWPA